MMNAHIMCVRACTYIVVDPLPRGGVAFIGISWLKYAARFQRNMFNPSNPLFSFNSAAREEEPTMSVRLAPDTEFSRHLYLCQGVCARVVLL